MPPPEKSCGVRELLCTVSSLEPMTPDFSPEGGADGTLDDDRQ